MDLNTLKTLCKRCEKLTLKLPDSSEKVRLLNMLETLLINPNWQDLKIGKWLGYIEGVLILREVTTVDIERDFTRKIYHAYYERIGVEIPQTTDVMKKK